MSHNLPIEITLAWDASGIRNGVTSLDEMQLRIARYRRDDALLDPRADPPVGCRKLAQPFFWTREQWLPVPQSFARNIVTSKRSWSESDGRQLFALAGLIPTLAGAAVALLVPMAVSGGMVAWAGRETRGRSLRELEA